MLKIASTWNCNSLSLLFFSDIEMLLGEITILLRFENPGLSRARYMREKSFRNKHQFRLKMPTNLAKKL